MFFSFLRFIYNITTYIDGVKGPVTILETSFLPNAINIAVIA